MQRIRRAMKTLFTYISLLLDHDFDIKEKGKKYIMTFFFNHYFNHCSIMYIERHLLSNENLSLFLLRSIINKISRLVFFILVNQGQMNSQHILDYELNKNSKAINTKSVKSNVLTMEFRNKKQHINICIQILRIYSDEM